MSAELKLTKKDFATDQEVRWCPGCGDYAILSATQQVFPELGVPKEKFVIVSSEEARKGRIVVRTVLEVSDDPGENVTLDYLLRISFGKWRIINVVANGVSDLSLKRADYGSVIKTDGFRSLIDKLNDQITEFESGN